MKRVVIGILAVLVLLTAALGAACFVHAEYSGVMIPLPDSTPDQAEFEREQRAINERLVQATGLSCIATVGFGLLAAVVWGVSAAFRKATRG